MFKMAIVSVAAAVVGIHSAGFFVGSEKKQSFISRVTLEEHCDLEANAFAVENLSTGEVRPFKYGEAFIRAKSSDWLKVVLNTDFNHVYLMVRKFERVSKSKLFSIARPKQLSTAFLTVLTTLFQRSDDGLPQANDFPL